MFVEEVLKTTSMAVLRCSRAHPFSGPKQRFIALQFLGSINGFHIYDPNVKKVLQVANVFIRPAMSPTVVCQ